METLGQLAASTSKPVVVPPHLRPAAVWLESKELAVYSETGRFVLLEDALQTKTTLRSPSLVSEPADRDSQSLWTLRQQLVGSGWTACKPGASIKPSVKEKTFYVDSQCQYYYIILLDCTVAVNLMSFFGVFESFHPTIRVFNFGDEPLVMSFLPLCVLGGVLSVCGFMRFLPLSSF